MSTTIEPQKQDQDLDVTGDVSQTTLSPQLSARWAIGPLQLLLVAMFAALFLLLNYFPLRATDLWGHVTFGNWILEHQALPTEDPTLPLAQGMDVIDTAWLSQIILALIDNYGGTEALSFAFALTVLSTTLILTRAFFLQTRRVSLAIVGFILVLAVGWSRVATIRPENFAALCFAVMLWMIVAGGMEPSNPRSRNPHWRKPWRLWLGIPIVMLLWANLHGSFVCGLAVLGCYLLGQMIDVAWKRRRLSAVFQSRSVRSWFNLCVMGLFATLINPYGIDLLLHTFMFSSNENLADVMEWQQLSFQGIGGWQFAMSLVLLLAVFRHSRRRVPAAHVLLLGVFGLAAVLGIRMLIWYAPVFALVLMPQLNELLGRFAPIRSRKRETVQADGAIVVPRGRSFKFTMTAAFLVWTSFAFSPVSTLVMNGPKRTAEQVLGPETPVALTEYLRANPPGGQIFNPQWWGDWLVYDGPDGIEPFVTTNMHLIPEQVWRDYLRVIGGTGDWQRVLYRYRIDTVILDKQQQRNQITTLRQSPEWRIVHQDKKAIVFRYKPPVSDDDNGEVVTLAPEQPSNASG